ncbi:HAD family hydrolase [Corynebacterium pelargi]|uniref:2-deoxyglucose-6-phosphate phosphatase n=1 Tax=Corynebacterium pelargi TaxID=1471400 RepID=A0A410W686_9CORY|nr:HAD family phosphatase [Corynebacterium pelargi]QAU51549.1 2-deoxyglucose-6-phosphate phosphatase [Corynebacterium pelargi]GGG82295.1 haloacid dehalogenase [Corynebacterium pelargi]
MNTFSNYSAVIFDFKGTLANDEHIVKKAYSTALSDLGVEPISEGEFPRGRNDKDIAAHLGHPRGVDPQLLIAGFVENYRALSNQTLLAGAKELLRTLHSHGIKLALASGTVRELVEPILERNEVLDLFDAVITSEDTAMGKPDPQGFLLAAQELGVAPNKTLVIEDSKAGVLAAQAAGMDVISVENLPGIPSASLLELNEEAKKLGA